MTSVWVKKVTKKTAILAVSTHNQMIHKKEQCFFHRHYSCISFMVFCHVRSYILSAAKLH